MKNPIAKDEKTTPVKKPRVSKQTKSTPRNTKGTSTVNPASKKAPAKPGPKKMKPAPVKAKTLGRKPRRPPSKTTKTTTKAKSTRSRKATGPKDPEDLVMNEWNLMDPDDFTDEVFDKPNQQNPSNAQQLEREKLVEDIMQEILPEEIPESSKTNQSSAKLPDEENIQEQNARTISASRSTKGIRLAKPLGFSLIGKTWGIKAMVALIIITAFLLVNHFVFIENNAQRAIEYISNTTIGDQRIIPNASLVEAEEMNHQLEKSKENVPEGMDLTQEINSPFRAGEESKPDQEISKQELSFWQSLAKTSLEEITVIQRKLAKLQDTPAIEDNLMDAGNDAMTQNSHLAKDTTKQSGLGTRDHILLDPDGNPVSGEARMTTTWKEVNGINSQELFGNAPERTPLFAAIGMEEKITAPAMKMDMYIPSVASDTERPIPEFLPLNLVSSEWKGLNAMVQTITVQMASLNSTTRDILNFLRETKPSANPFETIPEQVFQPRQNHQESGLDLTIDLADKFRISGFPDKAKVVANIQPVEVETTKSGETSPKMVKAPSAVKMMESLEFESPLVKEEKQFVPLLTAQSDDQLVIRSFSPRESGYASLDGVSIGDDVPGFGLVLNIKEDDTGRLLVMENGIVYLN